MRTRRRGRCWCLLRGSSCAYALRSPAPERARRLAQQARLSHRAGRIERNHNPDRPSWSPIDGSPPSVSAPTRPYRVFSSRMCDCRSLDEVDGLRGRKDARQLVELRASCWRSRFSYVRRTEARDDEEQGCSTNKATRAHGANLSHAPREYNQASVHLAVPAWCSASQRVRTAGRMSNCSRIHPTRSQSVSRARLLAHPRHGGRAVSYFASLSAWFTIVCHPQTRCTAPTR